MLQQTPVARVIPRLEEWLERWPTPADLAAVPPGEAVRAWDRLGYPRRALALHGAATAIAERHGNVVPERRRRAARAARRRAVHGPRRRGVRLRRAHPGGRHQRAPGARPRRRGPRRARARADPARARPDGALLPADPARARLVNAGTMELGQTVCTARAPRCDACPIADAVRLAGGRLPRLRRARGPRSRRSTRAATARCAGSSCANCARARRPCPRRRDRRAVAGCRAARAGARRPAARRPGRRRPAARLRAARRSASAGGRTPDSGRAAHRLTRCRLRYADRVEHAPAHDELAARLARASRRTGTDARLPARGAWPRREAVVAAAARCPTPTAPTSSSSPWIPPGSTDLDQAFAHRARRRRLAGVLRDRRRARLRAPGRRDRRRGARYAARRSTRPTAASRCTRRSISEGAASLLPDQVRGAFVWEHAARRRRQRDRRRRVARARIRSRRQLDYASSQADLAAGRGPDAALLGMLRDVGEARHRPRGGTRRREPVDARDPGLAAGRALHARSPRAAADGGLERPAVADDRHGGRDA